MATPSLPPLVQATSGAIGSATANALVYPLDLIATRVQTDDSSGLSFDGRRRRKLGRLREIRVIPQIAREVIREEGWKGLYDGLATDTAATIVSNFFYFYIYAFLRRSVVQRKAFSAPPSRAKQRLAVLSVPEELGLGFLSGVLSRAISTPLSMVTVRMQTQSNNNRKPGLVEIIRSIYREHGLLGFWKGFETTIALSLNPALTFSLIQLFQRILHRLSTKRFSSPAQVAKSATASFLTGALANSIAVAILYPLILAKTRLQSSNSDRRETFSTRGSAPTHQDHSALLFTDGPRPTERVASPLEMGDNDADRIKAVIEDTESLLKEAVHDVANTAANAASDVKEKLVEVHEGVRDKGYEVLDIWRDAYRANGARGLYQGLEVQIVKGFLNQGVTMVVKQRMEQLVVAIVRQRLRNP
ncbi:mitochondrial carrier [Punctularia strigosozonata HHB-11173 SS5]|uniref:mitochondrial carrier n=1 Tax=Punctularia strigosozonata (strain HHB-11173) TaxID=741275 RepID=UPI000441646C|nr:mitochondrial carrier [Punctularia strigosozonata HHB-11173 SS5]EIN06664.1 mitochondrial carrier [Punctularia strigosozonata HHB-11173 SS5]